MVFRIDGLEFPRRPNYYSLVPGDRRPVAGETASESSSADERNPRQAVARLRDGRFVSLAVLLAARDGITAWQQDSSSTSSESSESVSEPSPEQGHGVLL